MAVIAAATVMAEGAAPTLDLKFDTPQEITVGTTKVVFDGKIQDGMMFFGPKLYSMPAAGLAGEKGTILAKLTMEPYHPEFKGPRSLVTLRTKSRLLISIYTLVNRHCTFAFADQSKNIYVSNRKQIKDGEVFYAAITWNGDRVRCYMNGKLLQERKQEVPVKNVTTLNIGPFADAWYRRNPWGEENRIGLLKVWDRELDPAEIQRECGVKSKSAPEQSVP